MKFLSGLARIIALIVWFTVARIARAVGLRVKKIMQNLAFWRRAEGKQ